MIKINRISHVGVAVQSCSESAALYKLLGLHVEAEENVGADMKVAMLPVGESEIELLEPTQPTGTMAKYIEKRGEGIHHIALAVENLDEAVKELLENGVRMIDKAPRPGAGGTMVAFIHPAAAHGVLVELVQDKK